MAVGSADHHADETHAWRYTCVALRDAVQFGVVVRLVLAYTESVIVHVIQNLVEVAVTTTEVGERIERARASVGLSQRALADITGISQPTLSRVVSGQRAAKMPELAAIAWATGSTVAELAGTGTVAERVECAARATNQAGMGGMREALLHFLELDDYLDGQAIPATNLAVAGSVDCGE